MERLKRILSDKSGAMGVMTIGIILILMMLSSVIYEFFRLQITAQGVKDALQDALVSVCNENYYPTYSGTRQAHSGAYVNDGTQWLPSYLTGDIYSELDSILGTEESGGLHSFSKSGKTIYTLSGLVVSVTNVPMAADDNSVMFSLTAVMQVSVPLSFGVEGLPPMTAAIRVSGGLQGG